MKGSKLHTGADDRAAAPRFSLIMATDLRCCTTTSLRSPTAANTTATMHDILSTDKVTLKEMRKSCDDTAHKFEGVGPTWQGSGVASKPDLRDEGRRLHTGDDRAATPSYSLVPGLYVCKTCQYTTTDRTDLTAANSLQHCNTHAISFHIHGHIDMYKRAYVMFTCFPSQVLNSPGNKAVWMSKLT